MGQAVGLAVQLAISQGLRIELDRHRIRGFPGAIGEQLMHQALGREARLGAVPQLQDVLLLVAIQQVQLADVLLLVGNHRLQQILPVARHALDSGGFKQIGGITQRGPQPLCTFMHVQVEVEMRGTALPLQAFDAQVRQRLHTQVSFALIVEHHLEQRVQAQATLGLQGFHQLLERQVLMGLCLQRTLLDLGQQLGNRHVPVDIGLEHLSVDEKADQTFGFHTIAVGDRHTDTDVVLAAVAVQQCLERGQQ
ncbi:hypothetical protein [Pseudomonas sp. 58 R 3]|nr:hypothetical protein [Pseudomonas sp. 58 R 3]